MFPYLDLVLPLSLGVGGDPVDPPDLGEHGAIAQGEAEVQQPVGRRAHRREHGVRYLGNWRNFKLCFHTDTGMDRTVKSLCNVTPILC